MSNTLRRSVLIAVPLALLAGPAMASDSESDLLQSLGSFVLNGLGPPRTMEDIQREERQAAAAALSAARRKDEAALGTATEASPPVPPAPTVADAPVVAPPTAPAVIAPAVKLAKVEPAKVVVAEPKADVIPPPPRARPSIGLVKAALPVVALPPPEPLKSTIAATASVDQAIRLGGASGLYGRRLIID